MLNIPDTVKALFKADGVRKNFRVHFPNGELSDLTNANVVEESVRFTESLCSQDVLKFGLTEASVLEFETVGVANMYGMTIECGIEIDLSSLSAADLATIAAGSWDGTYVAAGDSDLGFAFFRVPYGVFRVESCPRDHQAMTHRKVQAYAATTQISDSPIELGKLEKMASYSQKYTPNIERLLYASAGFATPKFLDNLTKSTAKQWNTWPSADEMQSWQVYSYAGQDSTLVPATSYAITVSFTESSGAVVTFGNDTGELAPDMLYSLELGGASNVDTAIQQVANKIDQLNSGWVTSKKAEILAAIRKYLQINLKGTPTIKNNGYPVYYSVDGGIPVFYPYFGNSKTTIEIIKSTKVTISCRVIQGSLQPITYSTEATVTAYNSAPTLYKFTGIQSTIRPAIQPVSEYKPKDIAGALVRYSYAGSYALEDFVDGFLELRACFGRTKRNGSFEMFRLSNSSPVSVAPGEYSGFWWDEYDVLPIGAVKYSYTDADNNEIIIFYQFGADGSLYDMTDNELIKVLNNVSESAVNQLLDESFIPYIGPITFTPIDLSMKGLPYIEVGDYLAVAAEDGTTAYSFNMRQELNGIQVLTATVESTSGDILEADL